MTNEEFQRVILERVKKLEDEQLQIKKTINTIYKEDKEFTEFKQEIEEKLNKIIEDNKAVYEIISKHDTSINTLRRTSI